MNFRVDRRQVTSVPTRETVTEIVHYYATHKEQFGHCRVASVTNNDAAYGVNGVAAVAEETTVTVQCFGAWTGRTAGPGGSGGHARLTALSRAAELFTLSSCSRTPSPASHPAP